MKLGPYILGPNDTEENGIYTGDARELAKAIPAESVDLIFTDPVYDRIDDYRWLAETAKIVLIAGGMVLAQVGSEYRYEAETAMRKCLVPLPLLAEVYSMAFRRMWKYDVMQGWKPYLWLFKGDKRNGGFVFDRFHSKAPNKHFHKWGDSHYFIGTYVGALTIENAVVFDPFTGGGTVPAVCKMLGRKYLAFEIDPETADIARERVRNTQPPLFVPEPEQLSFEENSEEDTSPHSPS